MLTKEECFDSVQYLFEHAHKCSNCVHVNIGCDECEQDNTMECDIAHYRLTCLIENYYEIFNPQPYKFEELKKGMWVWDDGEKCCFKCNPAISTDMAQCVTYNAFWYNCGEDEDEFFEEYDGFEEGRFFPVTKAMEYQKEK